MFAVILSSELRVAAPGAEITASIFFLMQYLQVAQLGFFFRESVERRTTNASLRAIVVENRQHLTAVGDESVTAAICLCR